jgi:hypothetical protein
MNLESIAQHDWPLPDCDLHTPEVRKWPGAARRGHYRRPEARLDPFAVRDEGLLSAIARTEYKVPGTARSHGSINPGIGVKSG